VVESEHEMHLDGHPKLAGVEPAQKIQADRGNPSGCMTNALPYLGFLF
jgi:hypothetical protein